MYFAVLFGHAYEVVLLVTVDFECTSFLVIKRADLRWNRSLEDLEQLMDLQDELLHAASR